MKNFCALALSFALCLGFEAKAFGDSCAVPPEFPSAGGACEIQTNYDEADCSGDFQVFTFQDLEDYVASDFGRDGGSNYKNLVIKSDLNAASLDIESPCKITVKSGVQLSGDFVSIDGRKGVSNSNGFTLNSTGAACVLSERDSAKMGARSTVLADSLSIRGLKTAQIGIGSTVHVAGVLVLESTGALASSQAIVKSNSEVFANSVRVDSVRTATLGTGVRVDANSISLNSSGDLPASDALIKSGAFITAQLLQVTASRTAQIGKNATIAITGAGFLTDLNVISTGTSPGSIATVKSGADISVVGRMGLCSENKTNVGNNAVIVVGNNLFINAASASKCTIRGEAVILAGSQTGNCAVGGGGAPE